MDDQEHNADEHLTMPPAVQAAILLSRALLGLYFALAGLNKILTDVSEGVGTFYNESFLSLKPAFLPEVFAAPLGYALPYLEILFGLGLLLGLYTRLCALVVAGMLLMFTTALILANDNIAGGGAGPFHVNIVLLSIPVLVLAAGPGRWSLDRLFGKRQVD